MTSSAVPRSCANAVPLWRAVLHALQQCLPEAWPQLLPALDSASKAARIAGMEADAVAFGRERERVAAVIQQACADVAQAHPPESVPQVCPS
mmetsp:Transcript_56431/g.129580  ORF Transcript_56431/g.129580 Transcript_56431/m.129580 type:complete len:92 (+) Transcript_56431:1-276(+)